MNDQFVNSAVYVLLAALGGSAITAMAGLEAGRRTARHTDSAELAARRLEAYANLLVAAGEALGTYRRNLDALSPDFGQEDADKANAHMADLAAALYQALLRVLRESVRPVTETDWMHLLRLEPADDFRWKEPDHTPTLEDTLQAAQGYLRKHVAGPRIEGGQNSASG